MEGPKACSTLITGWLICHAQQCDAILYFVSIWIKIHLSYTFSIKSNVFNKTFLVRINESFLSFICGLQGMFDWVLGYPTITTHCCLKILRLLNALIGNSMKYLSALRYLRAVVLCRNLHFINILHIFRAFSVKWYHKCKRFANSATDLAFQW